MNYDKRVGAAHLARRAGFGASPEELDTYENMEYQDLVERFIRPDHVTHLSDDLIFRRHPNIHAQLTHNPMHWTYRMLTTNNQLEEKITLFWHGVFATGEGKLNNFGSANNQIEMFRRHGIGKFDKLLLELAKDPAMIIWLDNQTNHKSEINENFGREILELFSMGVGNYTEQDIKECARAFTGWSVKNADYMALMAESDSIWPYGRIWWHFEYNEDDHDGGEKTFLGETGNLNGDDIIRIICKNEAAARFVSRHLYTFFVADEVPVPQWSNVTPRDPEAIDILAKAYMESDYSIEHMLRVLFNSDFFKEARFARVKSPAELVINTLRASGTYDDIDAADTTVFSVMEEAGFMGQKLTNPPSVEGWHTGEEWINSGALVDRVNFASRYFGDSGNSGVMNMATRVKSGLKNDFEMDELIESCLIVLGHVEISGDTYDTLMGFAKSASISAGNSQDITEDDITNLFKIISSSKEFQMC